MYKVQKKENNKWEGVISLEDKNKAVMEMDKEFFKGGKQELRIVDGEGRILARRVR